MRFNSRTKDYLLWPQILISPITKMSEFLFKCPKMKPRRLSSQHLDAYFSLSDLKILFYETAMKNLALFWAWLTECSFFRCCSLSSLWFWVYLFKRSWKTRKKQTLRTPHTLWSSVPSMSGTGDSKLYRNVEIRPIITVYRQTKADSWNSAMRVLRGSKRVTHLII